MLTTTAVPPVSTKGREVEGMSRETLHPVTTLRSSHHQTCSVSRTATTPTKNNTTPLPSTPPSRSLSSGLGSLQPPTSQGDAHRKPWDDGFAFNRSPPAPPKPPVSKDSSSSSSSSSITQSTTPHTTKLYPHSKTGSHRVPVVNPLRGHPSSSRVVVDHPSYTIPPPLPSMLKRPSIPMFTGMGPLRGASTNPSTTCQQKPSVASSATLKTSAPVDDALIKPLPLPVYSHTTLPELKPVNPTLTVPPMTMGRDDGQGKSPCPPSRISSTLRFVKSPASSSSSSSNTTTTTLDKRPLDQKPNDDEDEDEGVDDHSSVSRQLDLNPTKAMSSSTTLPSKVTLKSPLSLQVEVLQAQLHALQLASLTRQREWEEREATLIQALAIETETRKRLEAALEKQAQTESALKHGQPPLLNATAPVKSSPGEEQVHDDNDDETVEFWSDNDEDDD